MSTLLKAIDIAIRDGACAYNPLDGELITDDSVRGSHESTTVSYDTVYQLRKLVRDFYDLHADEFADGAWLVLNGSIGEMTISINDSI